MTSHRSQRPVSRRAFALSGLAAAAAVTFSAAAWPSGAATTAGRGTGVRVRLPAPTGPHPVGTAEVRLVDRARRDPWVPSRPYRELMVSVWYPARRTAGHPRAPHMRPKAAARFSADRAPGFGIPDGTVDWAATRTHAYEDARPDARDGRLPVLVYAAGAGDPRTWGTVLVEEMASRGYLVITVDHTYESPAVEFPDGRVLDNAPLMKAMEEAQKDGTFVELLGRMLRARVADTRFVLDSLGALPHGLSRRADPRRVGAFGQSAGGVAAAQSMYEDKRIAAGVDLDGTLELNQKPQGTNLLPVAEHGLDRPLLLMGREGSDRRTEPSWRAFWSHTEGWHRNLTLRGSKHQSYTDLQSLMPQAGLPEKTVRKALGTVDPDRARAAERAYVASFFDRWLRDHDDRLLDGPSPRFPEIDFV
ncbi:alpha/beta hydrolase [Streptomyces albiaxialis]|uniref:Alpha/beta hydrolase n=1 Tax=Streptomyces albiaxialis TaxID=329523 RepID=A0ABN2WJB2_9ACTN